MRCHGRTNSSSVSLRLPPSPAGEGFSSAPSASRKLTVTVAPLCKGSCRKATEGLSSYDCSFYNPSVIFQGKCHLPLHKGGFSLPAQNGFLPLPLVYPSEYGISDMLIRVCSGIARDDALLAFPRGGRGTAKRWMRCHGRNNSSSVSLRLPPSPAGEGFFFCYTPRVCVILSAL